MTEVDGQPIHFVHVRSPHEGATPLLLAHTYPGSSVDFLDVIDRLVDPVAHGGRAEDAFDVVVPDAPGYGWSNPVPEAGWTTARVARGLRHPDAHPGLRVLRRPRLRQRGARRPRARPPRARGLPRPPRPPAVLLPLGRPLGVRAPRAAGLRRARAHAVVPVGRRLHHHERLPPPDRRRGPGRLARGAARVVRAVRELRQRDLARAARDDPRSR